MRPSWFVVLAGLELASFAALWLLLRIAMPRARWRDLSASQLVGNAISKVLPGGAATGGVMQGRMLVVAGRPAGEVTSALSATGLMTTGVLLAIPVLTVPTLVIGPPPARQLQLGLVVSVVLAVAVMALGTAVLKWDRFVTWIGRSAGHLVHLVRRRVAVDDVERHVPRGARPGGRGVLRPLDPVAGRRRREPDARLRRPGRCPATPSAPRSARAGCCWRTSSPWRSGWSRSRPAGWAWSRPA